MKRKLILITVIFLCTLTFAQEKKSKLYVQTLYLQKLLQRYLETTPQMVKVMLDHLEAMGILQEVRSCEDTSCDSCSLSGSCDSTGGKGARVWKVVR